MPVCNIRANWAKIQVYGVMPCSVQRRLMLLMNSMKTMSPAPWKSESSPI
jgi:hypothetical protein